MLSMVVLYVATRIGNKAQFNEFGRQIKWYQDKCEAMEHGITPVLNLLGLEPDEQDVTGRPPRPNTIIEKCRNSLSVFK